MTWKNIHNIISNILCITLIGVLCSTFSTEWWSCGNSLTDINRMIAFGIGSSIFGLFATFLARQFDSAKQLQYWTELLLRILLVYAVFTTALLKAEGHFYNYSLFNGETKLANLEANTFANAFYGFSPIFQAYVGYAIVAGLVLICFKQTQRIGNVLMAVIMTNAIVLNYSFESCYILKNSIYLSVISYFIFADLPADLSFFTRSNLQIAQEYHPLKGNAHLINASSLFKIILLVGLYFHTHYYIEDAKDYRTSNVNSPITGVWKVTDVKFLKSDFPGKNRKDIQSFKSIILDK